MFKDLDDFQVCFQSSGILTWSSVGSEKLKPFKTHNIYSKLHRGRVKIKFSVVENVFTCRKWSRYLAVDILNIYVSLLYIKYSFFNQQKWISPWATASTTTRAATRENFIAAGEEDGPGGSERISQKAHNKSQLNKVVEKSVMMSEIWVRVGVKQSAAARGRTLTPGVLWPNGVFCQGAGGFYSSRGWVNHI